VRRSVRTFFGISALCVPALLLFGGAESAQATFPGRIGPLVFSSTTSGARDLLVANPVNGKTTRITDSPTADDDEPTWSGELGEPHIAFQSKRDGNLDIYVVDFDGSNEQRLTSGAAADTEPAWSPDEAEARIAFVSDRDGNREIYSMAADGSDVRRLTNDRADDVDPAWSPNGERIAFASNRAGTFDLYTMKVDGTDLRKITQAAGDDRHPSWSPDGSLVAFDRAADIYFIGAQGNRLGRLTFDGSVDREPVWAPNGGSMVFSSNRGGAFELWIMRSTGARQKPLTSGAAGASAPDWQRRVPLDVEIVLPKLAPGTGGRVCTSEGTEKNDTRIGGAQDDVLCGFGGDDILEGEDGADILTGGAGRDTLRGGPGPDTFYARDGERDVVIGGSGSDRARVDEKDKVIGVETRF
jgi:Tol biopolymer transport system component